MVAHGCECTRGCTSSFSEKEEHVESPPALKTEQDMIVHVPVSSVSADGDWDVEAEVKNVHGLFVFTNAPPGFLYWHCTKPKQSGPVFATVTLVLALLAKHAELAELAVAVISKVHGTGVGVGVGVGVGIGVHPGQGVGVGVGVGIGHSATGMKNPSMSPKCKLRKQ